MDATGIAEGAHDVAGRVDPEGHGFRGAGGVDRGEDVPAQQKAMRATGIDEAAHDVAGRVDPEGLGQRGARDVDRGEDASAQPKGMGATGRREGAHDECDPGYRAYPAHAG